MSKKQVLQFQQFLDLLLTLRPLYNIKEVLVIAKNLPKTSIKILLLENSIISNFSDAEMLKSRISGTKPKILT